MKLETLDILNRKAYAAVGDIAPEDRLDALHHFRSNVGKMWPALYRELMAARACIDSLGVHNDADDRLMQAYDAARRETDK